MIKTTKFSELQCVYFNLRDTVRNIVEEQELREETLTHWQEMSKAFTHSSQFKAEFLDNKNSLPNDLFERYLKTTYYFAKEWRILYSNVINSLHDLFKNESLYTPLVSTLFSVAMAGSSHLNDQIEWIQKEYIIKNVVIETNDKNTDTEIQDDQLMIASLDQKIIVLWYLQTFKRIKLDKLGQDQTKQAAIISFLIERSYKKTYDALRRPTERFTKKNLKVVLELFKKHEVEYSDIIEQVETDFKNAV